MSRLITWCKCPRHKGRWAASRTTRLGARSRINFLRESPDGRLWVNDLRGQLYTLDQNYQPHLYVDLDSANGGAGSIFPATKFTDGLAAGFITYQFNPDFANPGTDGFGKFYTIHMESAAEYSGSAQFRSDRRAKR